MRLMIGMLSSTKCIVVALATLSHATAQTDVLPSWDPAAPKLQAGQGGPGSGSPQAGALFGFSMGSGRLEGPDDALDDVLICAISEDDGARDKVGAAYVFMNQNLSPPGATPSRLLATPVPSTGFVNDGAQLGRLAVRIGNPRGTMPDDTPYDNLILIGCAGHCAEYPGPPVRCDNDGGSVEMFDYNSPLVPIPQKSLFAPPNAPGTMPDEVALFGHGLDLGDVTRDGIVDLIVGAPGTGVESDFDGKGRIYVFQGHAPNPASPTTTGFFNNPTSMWIGVNAVEPFEEAEDWGQEFGGQVAACNFTDDEAMEVLVGREDRALLATVTTNPLNPPIQKEPKGGSAYVLRGKYLHDLLQGAPYHPTQNPTGTLNRVNQPPWPDKPFGPGPNGGGLNPDVPEYQVLRSPFGDADQPQGPDPRKPLWADAFGWFVWNGGDLGVPTGVVPSALPGIDDAVVYSELADYLGDGDKNDPEVSGAGGLFIYYGTGTTGPRMVYDNDILTDHKYAVLLQRPSVLPAPHYFARFGRAFARLDAWRPSQFQAPAPAIIVGESGANWNSLDQAGIVHLFRLPLPPQTGDPLRAVDPPPAWGTTPLVEPPAIPPTGEPGEEGPQHLFGSWIVALNYKPDADDPGEVIWPGQEFVVSARQASVRISPSSVLLGAGRAFPFVQPPVVEP